MKRAKACGVLLFRDDPVRSFLLMRHADRLDLPKGHIDPDETDVACALRELQEETGIGPQDVELDPQFRFTHRYIIHPARPAGEPIEKTLVVFLGRLRRPWDVIPTEHLGFEWMRWDPPHRIQERTIDPLLSAVENHLGTL